MQANDCWEILDKDFAVRREHGSVQVYSHKNSFCTTASDSHAPLNSFVNETYRTRVHNSCVCPGRIKPTAQSVVSALHGAW